MKPFRSNIEKHIRYSGASHSRNQTAAHDDSTEDRRDKRFDNLLNRYYDLIICSLQSAESILIFGRGEAKVELKKRLESQGLGDRIVGVETTDKMSPEQILTEKLRSEAVGREAVQLFALRKSDTLEEIGDIFSLRGFECDSVTPILSKASRWTLFVCIKHPHFNQIT